MNCLITAVNHFSVWLTIIVLNKYIFFTQGSNIWFKYTQIYTLSLICHNIYTVNTDNTK